MNMVECYLGAVAWQLPRSAREDIVTELRDDILTRIEAVEARGGRPATDAEIADVLRATGNPATVAARYSGQSGLLPSEAVPWWWAHVRALAALIALVYAARALLALFSGQPVMRVILQAVGQGASSFLFWLGLLTLVYVLVVRHLFPRVLQRWDPTRLPPPRPRAEPDQSLVAHAAGLVFSVAFLLWWTGVVRIQAVPAGLSPGPVWEVLHWPVVVLMVLGIGRALVQMFQPARQQLAAALVLLIAIGTIAAGLYLLRGGPLVVLAEGAVSRTAKGLASGINGAGPVVLVVIVLAHLFEGWGAARRLLRDLRTEAQARATR